MFEIRVGQTVGQLTCVQAIDRKRWTNRGQESTEGQGGIGEPDRWLMLKCACGKTFEVWDSAMPAKEKEWLERDCGCGITATMEKKIPQRGRPPMLFRHKRFIQNFSLSIDAITKVGDLSFREQISLSAACERMIMAYEMEMDNET